MPDPNHIILPDHGIAAFLLCKCANSAIKRAFLTSMGRDPPNIHAADLFHYADANQIAASGLWTFAIVRDPWDRLASFWRDKFRPEKWIKSLESWDLSVDMTFEECCEAVAKVPDAKARGSGQHFRSQSWDIVRDGKVVPRFVGRFERIIGAWGVVRAHSKLPLPPLPVANPAPPGDPHTTRTIEIVAQRYRTDIEVFGYGCRRLSRGQ